GCRSWYAPSGGVALSREYTMSQPLNWLCLNNLAKVSGRETGFKGVFFCCQAIGSIMREHGYGKIINLSSTFSQSVFPGRSVYAGIKAGINHLTEALALEWAPHGIRVNAIAPTAINTPSRHTTLQGPILEKVLARIPLGRLATSDDLLGAVIYLSSEASDFV